MEDKNKGDILVVDDNRPSLRLATELLTNNGYKVRPVADGKSALMTALSKPPDLILLDIRLPDISGFEVCEKLKADEKTKDIPIIFISALNEVFDKVKAFSLGGVDYITKPIQSEEVLARVKTQIDMRVMQNNLMEQNTRLEDEIAFRKKAEDELRVTATKLEDLNEHLANMVRDEVSKRLHQEHLLIQQSKMAAIGETVGLITHQWRQPLNVISILLHDLRDAYEFGELTTEYINTSTDAVSKQLEFMSATIDDFRDFLKPSKKKSPFNIKQAIMDLLRMFKSSYKKNNIEVVMESDDADSDPVFLGYPNEFKQVILNILNNSRDAIISIRQIRGSNFAGVISIRIITNSDTISISITDNGGGIPDDIMDRIFEPYFSTKSDEKGTGLGLYMSKIIIENNMNGKLCARNAGDGSELIITLDCHDMNLSDYYMPV